MIKINKLINISNQDGQLVVTSRQIAEDFGKDHPDVTKSIENLIKGIGKSSDTSNLFIENQYQNEQNKQWYKEYLLTRDGFSLLVMGFNGTKALQWKLKYIEAFNKMEQSLRGQAKELSTREMLKLQFTYTEELDTRVSNLEGRMTIETGNQKVLCDLVNKKVISILGGKESPAYQELGKKAFSQCWKDFKKILDVASYKDTPIKDFDIAKKVIIDWKPNRELELMIKGCNAQIRI